MDGHVSKGKNELLWLNVKKRWNTTDEQTKIHLHIFWHKMIINLKALPINRITGLHQAHVKSMSHFSNCTAVQENCCLIVTLYFRMVKGIYVTI